MSLAVGLSVQPKVLHATRNEEVVNANRVLHRQRGGVSEARLAVAPIHLRRAKRDIDACPSWLKNASVNLQCSRTVWLSEGGTFCA